MTSEVSCIWFWQRIVSPHMAGLASTLARHGHEVVYVAGQLMAEDRALQGWAPPDVAPARLQLVSSRAMVRDLVARAPMHSVHLCQGVRANGFVKVAQEAIALRGLRQWAVMETLDDSGWRGVVKRAVYRRLFSISRPWLEGVLAIGARTRDWVVARGVAAENVFPFAYFLPDSECAAPTEDREQRSFGVIYVGQLIERKRVDLLILSMADLGTEDIALTVIGSGPLEEELRALAEEKLPNRVRWLGTMPISAIPRELSKADCLVLPSRHDGWGAVVSEALMVGTPAICSDACGSAEVVRASGVGGVFPAESRASLVALLGQAVARGSISARQRSHLAEWAQCLGTGLGAVYLQAVLGHKDGQGERPVPPWAVR